MSTPEMMVQVGTKIKHELDYYYSLTKILGVLSKLLCKEHELFLRLKEVKATTEEKKKIRAGKIKQVKINIAVHSSELRDLREEIEEIETHWMRRPNHTGFEEALSEAKNRFLRDREASRGSNIGDNSSKKS